MEGANIQLLCVSTWLLAAVWSVLPLFGWGEYVPEPYGLSCTIAWRRYHTSVKDAVYVICSFACFVLVPVLLIVASQAMILHKVYRISSSLNVHGIRTGLKKTEKQLSVVRERNRCFREEMDRFTSWVIDIVGKMVQCNCKLMYLFF